MSINHGAAAGDAIGDLEKGTVTYGLVIQNQVNTNPEYAKLNDNPDKKINVPDESRKKAKLAEMPTTADATKGNKDLPSVISQVGAAAAMLPNMYSMLGMINALIGGRSQTSRKGVIEDSLYGALVILVNKWGYDKVISVLNKALENNSIKLIDENYRDIVKNAIANLYKSAVEYDPNNIPVYSYSIVTTIGPAPIPIVTTVPDLYIQKYYIQSQDPYPGYIRWDSPDTENITYVFTERKIGDKYYTSPQEEIYSISEQELADGLDTYIENENLTARILNNLLVQQDSNIENNTKEKTLGKNSGGANSLQLLMTLLGSIATMTNSQKSIQLPVSVLNQTSVSSSLSEFEKNQADAEKLLQQTKAAATPAAAASSITSFLSTEVAVKSGLKIPQILIG
jgi:hypothetical protein